jgi:hypothetical protein
MADNVVANTSDLGGPTFKSDDDGTAHWPYAKMVWGADNTRTRVDTGASALPVQDGGNSLTVDGTVTVQDGGGSISVDDNAGSLTVDGSVTANAGTNLNTSALALEAGGNLAAIAASASVMDDWDESDRAKVNPIVGQAGVAAGAGAVGVTVQRVTLASDDPAVAALQILDNVVSGSEAQVDVVAALPAGNNNIGDVDVASVNGFAAHDAGIAGNPLIIGGVSSAAAPTSVSADQEAVRAWYLRNGAAATVVTAGGALIGGDATNGLDVDITRQPGPSYIASSAITQTNLDGLASSATWVAGWESNAIDNSSNQYKDYRINAVLRTEGAAVTAGECRMYLIAELDDSTWPDVIDGTESTETFTDTEERDAVCRLAATSANDTSTAANVYLMCPSARAVFFGNLPRKFVIFITQATGTTLETTGDPNQVYVAGVA